MPDVTVPQPVPTAPPAPGRDRPKKPLNKRKLRNGIIAAAVVAALGAGGFALIDPVL